MSIPEREAVEREYRWSVESMFADREEWETAYEDVRERVDRLRTYEGRVDESAATLLELLELRESVRRDLSVVTQYARLRAAEDTRDQEYQAMSTRASTLSAEVGEALSYLQPALTRTDESELETFLDEEPALREYEHYFEDVRRLAEHTRSPEVESVLSELGEIFSAPRESYSMLTNADMKFPTVERDGETVELSLSNFTTQLREPDREYRRRVHETFYEEWGDYRNTVGTTLQKAVTTNVKRARVRDYDTARQAALSGPNVPTEVYDTLVETVYDRVDALGRHTDLLRRSIGADRLEMWDVYVSATGDRSPEVPYERAVDLVTEAVAPLGDEYRQRMAEGLESRWVDVYESRGKRSGAFSSGTYDTQPYILLNYQDDVSSMYTLAHELGHSMHSELANDAQPWQYADYDIFVAEVASTVNETLLTHHLLENAADDLRAHALDQYVERFRSTLFRQTMFADFEQRLHDRVERDEALTPDVLDEIYGDLKRTFYGYDHVAVDDLISREWMRIPHFYMNFYVYQYATGIAAATAIVDRIRDDPSAAADYREALAMGGSDYPIEVLRTAGVDMTDAAPIHAAIDTYEDLLDRAEELFEFENA
jgi:oligoendopeptidase F